MYTISSRSCTPNGLRTSARHNSASDGPGTAEPRVNLGTSL
jgi:hypothetical protein